MEYLEDLLLHRGGEDPTRQPIREFLASVFRDETRADLLIGALKRVEIPAGSTLFEQGAGDTGLFIVESGSLSAFIATGDGSRMRVKKFKAGSLIGELSAYLGDKHRTATVVADIDAILYHLDLQPLENLDDDLHELKACIHELVATSLAERVSFMNRRLLAESGA